MIVLVLVLLVLELILLLRRVRIVHEISTTLLVCLILSTKIVLLLLICVDRLGKGGRSGRIDPIVGGIIILLILKWEIQSQAVIVWLHLA